ncbi:hypothetical protein OPU71_18575 [Niveibacterium sp. 24ML]|uniref:hypothetical protein n=1 Tax=Niveibacterium sp. 24ML TaxID=2985512 RepID=UPI00226DA059|nr:hypothetical protein [Niveibacterium sp. 24ML]MCX9158132.1 hypothetical protein [Niveibacterium sp. 24ML]
MSEQHVPAAAIAVHDLSGLQPEEACDEARTNPNIKDGDVLDLGEGDVAVLVAAWPVMVVGHCCGFHELIPSGWERLDGGKYLAAVSRAHELSREAAAKRGPTRRQREALTRFRDAYGRDWKYKLNLCWTAGNYRAISTGQAALLQQVRNELGPEWLDALKDADLD